MMAAGDLLAYLMPRMTFKGLSTNDVIFHNMEPQVFCRRITLPWKPTVMSTLYVLA